MTMKGGAKFFALAAALGLLFVACNGSNSSPTSASGTGHLTIKMTDAPTDEVSEINVYVTGLTIKKSDAPVQRIATDLGIVDLLTLQGTTKQLVDLGVPAGDYEFVQVELDQSRSNVVVKATGDIEPLKIASEQIKVLGGFTVPEGGDLAVTLDFKADESLNQLGNGDWLLTPVITQVSP